MFHFHHSTFTFTTSSSFAFITSSFISLASSFTYPSFHVHFLYFIIYLIYPFPFFLRSLLHHSLSLLHLSLSSLNRSLSSFEFSPFPLELFSYFITLSFSLPILSSLRSEIILLCWQYRAKNRPTFLSIVENLEGHLTLDFAERSFYHNGRQRKETDSNSLVSVGTENDNLSELPDIFFDHAPKSPIPRESFV